MFLGEPPAVGVEALDDGLQEAVAGLDAPALRILVRHALAFARQGPRISRRQRRREAALVQVDQPQAARRRFFFKFPSTFTARAALAGSRLWASVCAVRR